MRKKIGLTIMASALAGVVSGQLERESAGEGRASDAGRITFGTNFFVDPCGLCKYNSEPSGWYVWGPTNCTSPGDVQSVAVPFIAAADGVPDRISTSIILHNPTNCPTNEVTLGLYSDVCGNGPGALLASGEAVVGSAPCGLTVARLSGAPALIRATKYWIAATTNAGQSALDARWYASNTGGYSFDAGDGWQPSNGATPAFSVQGPNAVKFDRPPEADQSSFGGNLFRDPCTGCTYDINDSGFDVRGPDNCTSPGQYHWEAVPFVAKRTGVPRRISAAIKLYDPRNCPANKVTLSLYSDNNCNGTPGRRLISAQAIVPSDGCELAVAKLRNSPTLTEKTKYWVVATTTAAQAGLDARWIGSNNAQFSLDLGDGWGQYSAGTPAFLVE